MSSQLPAARIQYSADPIRCMCERKQSARRNWIGPLGFRFSAHHDAFGLPSLSRQLVVNRAKRCEAMVGILALAGDKFAGVLVVKPIDREWCVTRAHSTDVQIRSECGLFVVPARLRCRRLRLDVLQRNALGRIGGVEMTVGTRIRRTTLRQ